MFYSVPSDFLVQLINILCFTMCISHYVLQCAGLIF
ncbi:hypothetical protein T4D_2921 [Trichinella pseudospiralis]|uniref:Uncharacterized protein n=1 Tax=Trichinella pseudospiralis TaxID=6337 RepID=A0A0V1DPP0_TRIPS|nr:hypothetical protein T4D_2921 [Trichinella pseudospiralis]